MGFLLSNNRVYQLVTLPKFVDKHTLNVIDVCICFSAWWQRQRLSGIEHCASRSSAEGKAGTEGDALQDATSLIRCNCFFTTRIILIRFALALCPTAFAETASSFVCVVLHGLRQNRIRTATQGAR